MKLLKKSKSIQSTLFFTYFYILFVVLITFMSISIISESKKIKNNAFLLMKQNVNTISSYIDEEANTLNTVALNIAYSNLIKERFTNYINADENVSSTNQDVAYDNIQNTKELIDMLTTILGPNQPVVQIYLYSLDKGVFGVGLDTTTSKLSAKDFSWYKPFISSSHYRLLSCDQDKRLEDFYSYKNGANFISLYEMYYNSYNIPQGIIEVKNPISYLTQKIKNIVKSYGEEIYIYDQNGNSIYPDFLNSDHSAYFSSIASNEKPINSDEVITDRYDKNTYMFYKTSEDTGFTVTIAVKNNNLFKPIYEYIKSNVIILLIIALAMLLLSFIAAHIITTPITKIYRQVQSFKLDMTNSNKNIFPDIDTHIIEFNTLYSALVTMQQKAQRSMEREITLQNQEMQSRMLALQSQMNPHFLYNSLATIQCMADEHMDDEIQLMCQNISSILRYIASDKELLVPLKLEVEHTLEYLSCMKTRYDDDIIYEIAIPNEMQNIKIPKLCLQLIVENSIKFATKSVKPPWKININGTITNSYWELSISDNGTGFADSEIEILNEKINEINKTGLLPNLEISGMGLMNIYIRFKLLYKGSHIFRISNLAHGGALLTIGGKINE
jgi:sensor histidine kinase YesM